MSATVIDMRTYRPMPPQPEQIAADGVAERIKTRVVATILCQAQARAARSVRSGIPVHNAIDRACAWALANTSPDDPLPPRAA